jgi:hypothetical protein
MYTKNRSTNMTEEFGYIYDSNDSSGSSGGNVDDAEAMSSHARHRDDAGDDHTDNIPDGSDSTYDGNGSHEDGELDSHRGDQIETAEYFVCPLCGDTKPGRHPASVVPGLSYWYSCLRNCVCEQGHAWAIVRMPLPEDRAPSSVMTSVRVMPREELIPRDTRVLTCVLCPYCGFGPEDGVHISDAYPFNGSSRWTVVRCHCHNGHDWGLVLVLDKNERKVPMRSVTAYLELFDEYGNSRVPDFDIDAALREVDLITRGEDGLDEHSSSIEHTD